MSNPAYKKCPYCRGIRHKKRGKNHYECTRCGVVYHRITREIIGYKKGEYDG